MNHIFKIIKISPQREDNGKFLFGKKIMICVYLKLKVRNMPQYAT